MSIACIAMAGIDANGHRISIWLKYRKEGPPSMCSEGVSPRRLLSL